VSPIQQLEKGTYSLAEASIRIGIAPRTGRDLHTRGEFPVRILKIGGRYKVLVAELERFLAGEQVAS
jgi:hypothetical protein